VQAKALYFLFAIKVAPFDLTHITVAFLAASVRKLHLKTGMLN
jgi:hypothetical protein